tara:strand:+ start:259 stop:609 length:351 start_codon:yes stop_codon:yes gene_type:complete
MSFLRGESKQKGEIERKMAPHIGEPERKKHWLSLWHATVEILGDPTVGGGNANSNLQPYIKQSSCHRLATQKKQICLYLQILMGPKVIISSGLPKKRRKFCPPLSKFLYIFKTFFF